jgi:hypothetical protein
MRRRIPARGVSPALVADDGTVGATDRRPLVRRKPGYRATGERRPVRAPSAGNGLRRRRRLRDRTARRTTTRPAAAGPSRRRRRGPRPGRRWGRHGHPGAYVLLVEGRQEPLKRRGRILLEERADAQVPHRADEMAAADGDRARRVAAAALHRLPLRFPLPMRLRLPLRLGPAASSSSRSSPSSPGIMAHGRQISGRRAKTVWLRSE